MLPRDADVEAVSALAERLKLARGVGDPTMRYPDGDTLYELVPWARCWCGHVLGSLGDAPKPRSDHERERELAKVRKRGWGEAKIERWFRERDRHEDRVVVEHERALAGAGSGPEGDWTAFIRGALESGSASRIGLVHYSTIATSDDVRFGPTTSLGAFGQRDLDTMDFGAILTVVR